VDLEFATSTRSSRIITNFTVAPGKASEDDPDEAIRDLVQARQQQKKIQTATR